MSYDISLSADLGGEHPWPLKDWNCTSNCAPMWRAAGADLATFDGQSAADCIPVLTAAIAALRADPERFRAMDSPNGWGTYSDLVPALENLLAVMRLAPRAFVRVSR